jgi:hypothetical protein
VVQREFGPFQFGQVSVSFKKKGDVRSISCAVYAAPKSSKKNSDKQYLGLAKFSAATRVSDLFLP